MTSSPHQFSYPSDRLYNGVRLINAPAPNNVNRLDMGIMPVIDRMHENGVYIDTALLSKLSAELVDRLHDSESRIKELVGKSINPGSPHDVAKLLFRELKVQGADKVRYTDSGDWEATGADQLKLYRHRHPVVETILDWRHYKKLKTTYVDKIPTILDENGRLHTQFNTTRAFTGRLTSSNPINLQNIPVRTDLGRQVRNSFVATPGWVLYARDLSQIEMRWAAHYSGEPSMVEGYKILGWDIHSQTALDVFGLDTVSQGHPQIKAELEALEHVTKPALQKAFGDELYKKFELEYRLVCKTIGFGVLYLMGAAGLQMGIVNAGGEYRTEARCQQFIDQFYSKRPYIREIQDQWYRTMRRHGMVWDAWGRVRIIPQVRSHLRWIVNEGLREGANMPIQGAAQGSIKLAMAELGDRLEDFNRGEERVRELIQIHDEMLWEVKEGHEEEWHEITGQVMDNAHPFLVPLASDGGWGERWGEMK